MKGNRTIRKGIRGDQPALTAPGIVEFPGCANRLGISLGKDVLGTNGCRRPTLSNPIGEETYEDLEAHILFAGVYSLFQFTHMGLFP